MDSSAVIVYKHQYKQFNIHMIHSNPKKKKKKNAAINSEEQMNNAHTMKDRQMAKFFFCPLFFGISRAKKKIYQHQHSQDQGVEITLNKNKREYMQPQQYVEKTRNKI